MLKLIKGEIRCYENWDEIVLDRLWPNPLNDANKIFECSITNVPVHIVKILGKIHYWKTGIFQLGNITWKHYLETLPRTITWKQNLETQFGNIWNFRNFATMNFKKVMMYRGESESLTLIILDQPTNHLPRSNNTDIERTYHFCVKSSWYQFQDEMGGHRWGKDSNSDAVRKNGQTWKCM